MGGWRGLPAGLLTLTSACPWRGLGFFPPLRETVSPLRTELTFTATLPWPHLCSRFSREGEAVQSPRTQQVPLSGGDNSHAGRAEALLGERVSKLSGPCPQMQLWVYCRCTRDTKNVPLRLSKRHTAALARAAVQRSWHRHPATNGRAGPAPRRARSVSSLCGSPF